MENREVLLKQIRRAYQARDAGALDDVIAHFHPEAVFTLAGDQGAADVVGSLRGHAQMKEGMAQLMSNFAFVKRDIISELVDGDRAAIRSRVTMRYCPKNIEQETEMVDLFRFEDGKIIELVEFADTAAVMKMIS